MEMVTFSSKDEQLSYALSFETTKRSNLRDVSFSSYLDNTEEFLVLKLAESNQSVSTPTSTGVEDGEIGVFEAEKYFNGGMDNEQEEKPTVAEKSTSATNSFRSDKPPVFPVPVKSKIQARTPSVHSEASWNSQSALLQSALRHSTQRKVKKVQGKSFLSTFGCRCACADKNSVEIDDHARCGEAQGPGKHDIQHAIVSGLVPPARAAQAGAKARENNQVKHFHKWGSAGRNAEMKPTFPTTVSGEGILPPELQFLEETRKSLEVFGSPILRKKNESVGCGDGRSTMLRWEEAIARAEEMDITSANCGVYTDTESDASSDLFELDSLTGKSNQYIVRQASDGLPGCVTPTTCYAPSEVSIDWSVITASAADYSVMSDSEELKTTKFPAHKFLKEVAEPPKAKIIPNKDVPRRGSSSFLGCKSQKAANVAGDAFITNEIKGKSSPRMRHKPEMFTPVSRFPPEAKLIGFESRNRQRHSYTARPISRSYSSQGSQSHVLYIQ